VKNKVVVRSRNVLKRNSMRFAAALLGALAIFVAGPNAALAQAPQHHDQVAHHPFSDLYMQDPSGPTAPFVATLAEREREMIEAALAECQGRISGPSGAAAKLGIPRQTLDSKIRALQINKHRFKTP
jgi:DNA-binding NtrC family response regulator